MSGGPYVPVDTTEEESIDRELIGRRASDGLYSNLNKAAVIGVGALPVIGAAAVAVKQNVHDVLQEQRTLLTAKVAAQGHSNREKQLGGLLEGNAELTARVAAQNQDKLLQYVTGSSCALIPRGVCRRLS